MKQVRGGDILFTRPRPMALVRLLLVEFGDGSVVL